jgi:hypothetical protein
MQWRSVTAKGSDLHFCWRCVKKIKTGFYADMIQLTAIADLHEVGLHYLTLERGRCD